MSCAVGMCTRHRLGIHGSGGPRLGLGEAQGGSVPHVVGLCGDDATADGVGERRSRGPGGDGGLAAGARHVEVLREGRRLCGG